jgi:hypothetical protein
MGVGGMWGMGLTRIDKVSFQGIATATPEWDHSGGDHASPVFCLHCPIGGGDRRGENDSR